MASLFQWLAWMLVAIGALLGCRALLGDRSRGRRRCPRCWYSMEGATGLKCPECGREAKSERQLFRSRRRWRWMLVAIPVLLAAPVVGVYPRAARNGWYSVLPLRMVVELLPIGGANGDLGKELSARMGTGLRRGGWMGPDLSESDRLLILRRCVEGNWLARPIDQAWRESYGMILKRSTFKFYSGASAGPLVGPNGEPAGDELAALVAKQAALPALLTLKTRPVWPEGMRVAVDAQIETWWPPFMLQYVDGTWSANGGAAKGKYAGSGEIDFNVGLKGPVTVDFDLDIVQDDNKTPGHPHKKVQHETRRVSYTTVPTLDELMPPASGPAIDDLLKRGLYLTWNDLGLDVDPRNLSGNGFDDVAFGVDAEIMHNGQVVIRQRIRWRGVGSWAGTTMEGPRDGDWQTIDKIMNEARGQSGWTVRLKPEPQWALYIMDAKRYWTGDVEVPMDWGDGSRRVPPQRPMRPPG
jgi:hypothetical protein